jgi:dTDP-4-dehydrorhamnose 3,5-epimerase
MNPLLGIVDTPLQGLKVLQRNQVGDERGYIERMFCSKELEGLIPGKRIAQISNTMTVMCGTVRGMHFQYPPHAETKFVSCLRGEVFDVAVDVRQGSPTFLRWHAEILSGNNHRTLLIPDGFAHGFQTLTDHCELLYFHTNSYYPAAEGGLNVGDPQLDIHWPKPIIGLSPRDAARPMLTKEFVGVVV